MPIPTRNEYLMALKLMEVDTTEITELEVVLAALCIVAYLQRSQKWTHFQAVQLLETFNSLTR